MLSRRMDIVSSDSYFSMMPFFHAGGSILGLMTMPVNGGAVVFTEAFNPTLGAWLADAEQSTIHLTILYGEAVRAALDSGVVFSSVRMAPLTDDDTRKAYPNALSCFYNFEMTEAYSSAALSSFDPARRARGWV